MADIEVTDRGGGRFHVEVQEASSRTEHDVSVRDEYVSELGLGEVGRVELVEASFRFLLEREPKESIMRSFDLSTIERFFGEYPDEIRRRLGGR